MNAIEIKKKKEALRLQIMELDKQEKKIERIEKEKAAERFKKNYENNRDALAAILLKLHSKDFDGFDLAQLKVEVTEILMPPEKETAATKNRKAKTEDPIRDMDVVTETALDSSSMREASQLAY